jgi:hypothetical protein
MKKLSARTLLAFALVMALALSLPVACSGDSNSAPADNSILLAGYIVIEGDFLYLDEAEVLMTGNEDDLLLLNVMELDVAIAINDEERMAELDLRESDFLNSYYIHNPGKEIAAYELTDETVYSFIDVYRLFTPESGAAVRYSTTKKDEFLQHLGVYYDPPNPPYVIFVKVQDGKVLSVTEVFLFTM